MRAASGGEFRRAESTEGLYRALEGGRLGIQGLCETPPWYVMALDLGGVRQAAKGYILYVYVHAYVYIYICMYADRYSYIERRREAESHNITNIISKCI